MRITLMVSCKNGMPYLEACLQSVLTASAGVDVEFFYEDAGSTDGSIECARQLLGDARVNVQADRGFGDAANRVFAKSTGEVFGTLGADDLLAPDALRAVAQAFENSPQAQWAVGEYQIIDPDGRPIRHWHTAYKNFAIRHFSLTWLLLENIVPNVSFYIRRDFRQQIGDMLLERDCLANDYDYFLRCALEVPPAIIPQVVGRWRYHPTSQSGKNMRRMSRDVWAVCRSHTRNPLIWGLNGLLSLRMALLYNRIG